jgi:flagellar capping protein FliD
LAADREKLEEERTDLERQCLSLEATRKEQLEKLDRERQKLEDRSARLDRMRQELEQVSVVNLESRLAAEEAMAELMVNVDEQVAKQRVEEVRAVVAGQFRRLKSTTGGSEAETARLVAIAQGRLEEEDERLRTERDLFQRRMNDRERELQEQETRLENRMNDWEQRESRWRHMRDDWLEEKLNAEQIIRRLLEELSTGDRVAA